MIKYKQNLKEKKFLAKTSIYKNQTIINILFRYFFFLNLKKIMLTKFK